jgi:predicted dehydrogenase
VGAASVILSSESKAASSADAPKTAPSDRISLGIIGAGSRGQQLMRTFLQMPGVKFRGICDVYDPRFTAGRKITGEETPTYKDYRQLLDTKDLDAVVVATPLSFHAAHVVAALQSGRHVYGEKSLARTVPECDQIVDAVKRTGKHFQVGLQYTYAPWVREAISQIHAGKLGQVTHIFAYWHRNNNWRRPVPDPHDEKLERLINWRLYKEYSGGLLAELGSHQINFANRVLGAMPESAVGSGGIDYWKDGRETNDNVQVIFRYPAGQTLVFSSITTNRFSGAQMQVLGTKGTAVVTDADATMYYERSALPKDAPELVVERGVITGASYRAEVPYRGQGTLVQLPPGTAGNADYAACSAFVESLRKDQKPVASEQVGWAAGVSVALGNQAIEQGKRIVFSDHVKKADKKPG